MQTMNSDQVSPFTNPHMQNAPVYPSDPMGRNMMNQFVSQARMQHIPGQMPHQYANPPFYNSVYMPNNQMMPPAANRYPTPHISRPPNEMPASSFTSIPYGAGYPYVASSMPQPYQYGPAGTMQMAPMGMQPSIVMNPSLVPVEQQVAAPPAAPQAQGKRARNPIPIVDPESKKTVEVPAPLTTNTNTDENRPKEKVKGPSESEATKPAASDEGQAKRDAYRQDFAKILGKVIPEPTKEFDVPSPAPQTDDLPKEEKPVEPARTATPVVETISTKSPVTEPSIKEDERTVSETPVENQTEEKSDTESKVEETEKPTSDESNVDVPVSEEVAVVEASDQASSSTSSSRILESDSRPIEKTPSGSKRTTYSRSELFQKQNVPSAQVRPVNLQYIEGVTTQRPSYPNLTGRDSYSRSSNRDSITLERVQFQNRSDNPYVRADQNRIDALNKFLREVKAILNKVTPQTYEKLLKQLDDLELTNDQRLEGMIQIIFGKAVEEPSFCSLYANICKHFQRKQVTVPDEEGQVKTFMFRQILLTRCQREFETGYRQDIDYEKRLKEVQEITDEKANKEAAEKLEEDLGKAKRKKLGNIYFIGELFKLQMLTDTIMYDCIDYLLRDKSDEESLECLCRLLRTIGKELDSKASEKASNKNNLEKQYRELENIIQQRQTSARIRFMIQDLLEQRKAAWVARRAEIKPVKIDEIHEQERLKREQQEREQDRERQQRRPGGQGNPPQYMESRGSRGSGIRQQSNRNDDERSEPRFNVNSVRQLQTNDKRNQGSMPLNLAPQRGWAKGSGIEKKVEEDRSFARVVGKPPMLSGQSSKSKTSSTSSNPVAYGTQRQPSRELVREPSQRDRMETSDSFRRTTNGTPLNRSPEGSRNVSREQSRNASRESSVVGRQSSLDLESNSQRAASTNDSSDIPFDEEKTKTRVHSLIEEYTENYSENTDRPVKEALEDLSDFCTANEEHQAIIVRELFNDVLEAKPRARKAVGHLLDYAFQGKILSTNGILKGFKLVIEIAPDMAVDIPLIWKYIGEIIGAFIGAPSSNLFLLKEIISIIPDGKSQEFFDDVIRYATEFSSKAHVQQCWISSGLTLNDLFISDKLNSEFVQKYDWLNEVVREKNTPSADPKLVKLFKSFNDQGSMVSDDEIISYIQSHMDENDKFYVRNIVLSYLEACLVNVKPQPKIQEDIARGRMAILQKIIDHKTEAEIQAIYAIQNFVHRLEHPQKMAQLLFDIFYDCECVSEDSFLEWQKNPDPSENEGHSIVVMSTQDFFKWLQEADQEDDES